MNQRFLLSRILVPIMSGKAAMQFSPTAIVLCFTSFSISSKCDANTDKKLSGVLSDDLLF